MCARALVPLNFEALHLVLVVTQRAGRLALVSKSGLNKDSGKGYKAATMMGGKLSRGICVRCVGTREYRACVAYLRVR